MVKKHIHHVKKHGPKFTLLVAGVVLAVAVGIFAGNRIFKKKETAPVQAKKEQVITYSTDKPDESKKNADAYNWRGAPEDPKKLRIGKIGVDAFIQQAGVDQNKAVAVPNNVHLASWFSESVRPGQLGLSIIDGHVSGPTVDGVFKNLTKLAKDDKIEIEQGNGTILKYKVVEKVELKVADSAAYLFSQKPEIKSQLNLITCGGQYDRAAKQFVNRVIVAATLQ
ncbi:MAG: class F sortase [Candidatus Saccharibacteria bacterium]|nr:class F sortase [Candidatus Saccharibacteria bacterium]